MMHFMIIVLCTLKTIQLMSESRSAKFRVRPGRSPMSLVQWLSHCMRASALGNYVGDAPDWGNRTRGALTCSFAFHPCS